MSFLQHQQIFFNCEIEAAIKENFSTKFYEKKYIEKNSRKKIDKSFLSFARIFVCLCVLSESATWCIFFSLLNIHCHVNFITFYLMFLFSFSQTLHLCHRWWWDYWLVSLFKSDWKQWNRLLRFQNFIYFFLLISFGGLKKIVKTSNWMKLLTC